MFSADEAVVCWVGRCFMCQGDVFGAARSFSLHIGTLNVRKMTQCADIQFSDRTRTRLGHVWDTSGDCLDWCRTRML